MTTIELRSLVTGENKKIVIPKDFEKLLNGSVQATEFDYDRACETFQGLIEYYS